MGVDSCGVDHDHDHRHLSIGGVLSRVSELRLVPDLRVHAAASMSRASCLPELPAADPMPGLPGADPMLRPGVPDRRGVYRVCAARPPGVPARQRVPAPARGPRALLPPRRQLPGPRSPCLPGAAAMSGSPGG